jgi:hypothetical protein
LLEKVSGGKGKGHEVLKERNKKALDPVYNRIQGFL